MATTKRSSLGTLDEFLNLPRHILEVLTSEEHNKREIWVVGQSGCGLIYLYKYEICGERNERCQKLWLFPSMQCGGDVENRGKVSMH